MLRSSLIVAAATLLCATAGAQNRVPSNKVLPIKPQQVHQAGRVDVQTGQWTTAQKAVQQVNVFNNTCFPYDGTGYIYYTTLEYCSEFYDEGQIPASDNTDWESATGGTGNANSYVINEISFTYCVNGSTPDMEMAFFDNLPNGGCPDLSGVLGGGNSPWKVHGGTPGNGAAGYFDVSGLGLPGGTTGGGLNCWFVTLTNLGFTLQGDGDGAWDNSPDTDVFIWGAKINNVPPSGGANGMFLVTDPAGTGQIGGNYGPGNCTFDVACGTDWAWGSTFGGCGNGYNTEDHWWINTDTGVAGTCLNAAASGCYWFGGYPTGPYGSFWMRLGAEADIGGAYEVACDANQKVTSAGCLPTLTLPTNVVTKGAVGSVFAPLTNAQMPATPGMLIFAPVGNQAAVATPYGELCMSPFFRASTTATVPTGTAPCGGTYNFDIQKLVNDAQPGQADVGAQLIVQGWFRDNGFAPPGNADFSNAVKTLTVQ